MNTHIRTLNQRTRLLFISFFYLGTPRRSDFKCWDFVKHVMQVAKISNQGTFTNITDQQKDKPPFGSIIFLLEKGLTEKKWSHVGIAAPFGYFIHMSYYWGEKVTITPLKKIWEKYDLVHKIKKPTN